MDCGLLRSAVVGKSIKQSHWNRVFCKCCFLYSTNHSSLGFYSEKQLAETVWPLQIVRSCTAVSLLCAADDSGIRKPLERRCSQLHAVLIGKLRVGVEETMSLGELIQPIQRYGQKYFTDCAVRFCLQKRQCVAREGCTHQILIAFSQQRSGTGGIGKQLPIVQQTGGIEIFLYLG